jgi:hypothetical protein
MHNWIAVLARERGVEKLQAMPADSFLNLVQGDTVTHQHPQRFAVSGITGLKLSNGQRGSGSIS